MSVAQRYVKRERDRVRNASRAVFIGCSGRTGRVCVLWHCPGFYGENEKYYDIIIRGHLYLYIYILIRIKRFALRVRRRIERVE